MKRIFLLLLCIIGSLQVFAQNEEQAYPLLPTIWKTNKISVCWDNPTAVNAAMREVVRQVVKDTWEKNSALEFTDWVAASDKDCDIHIFIEDDGPHTKGLGNTLKNKPKGMVLNFTFERWSQNCRFSKEFCIKAIAVHEFGHALGFAHEQNRDDCHFPNCFKKEQGTDGDWYMTPCDTQSVMNYCNPKWSNDGILSELDIKAVQYLYGQPKEQAPSFGQLQLVHTSNQIAKIRGKRISHVFKVYLVGGEEELGQIEKVVYHLHPTFKRQEMTMTNPKDYFGIGLRVWGEFEVSAEVFKKDKSKVVLKRYLDFEGKGVSSNGGKDKLN